MLEWFIANGEKLFMVIGLLVSAATIVVKLTKTPVDDAFLDKIKALLRRFSLFGYRDEQTVVYIPKVDPPAIIKRMNLPTTEVVQKTEKDAK